MKLKVDLPLAKADTICAAALAEGRKLGLRPLAIAVLDAGGNPVVAKREDGAGILRTSVATGKAWGALGMGESGRQLAGRMASSTNFVAGLAAASDGRFFAAAGGVLILDAGGDIVGAVGISGDKSEADERCAIVGIRAAGFGCEPGEPKAD